MSRGRLRRYLAVPQSPKNISGQALASEHIFYVGNLFRAILRNRDSGRDRCNKLNISDNISSTAVSVENSAITAIFFLRLYTKYFAHCNLILIK